MINVEEYYLRLKENRAKDNQLDDIERDRIIEHVKRTAIDKMIKQN